MNQRIMGAAIAAALLTATVVPAAPYSIAKDEKGHYWFADGNQRFLSLGVNTVLAAHDFRAPANTVYYDAVKNQFGGNFTAWQKSVASILHDAGFNTVGAWSTPAMNDGTLYDTPILYVAGYEKLRMIDALSPGFEDKVTSNTKGALKELSHPDRILGVFLDNEMAWYGMSGWDDNPRHTILEEAFKLEATHPHHVAALDFLKSRYKTAADFSAAWGVEAATWQAIDPALLHTGRTPAAVADRKEFLRKVADAFFSRSAAAVHKALPGTLILGCRFAGNAPDDVIAACGRHCDVVSFNNYSAAGTVDTSLVSRYWILGGKPLMITEFAWRARENTSGNPNTGGAGSVVDTQRERGERYSRFVADNLSLPMMVGMHWFQFSDQSPQGRFDGENSNYGVVDIQHRPYKELLGAMATTNHGVMELHAKSTTPAPTELPSPTRPTFLPGQFPNRPPSVELIGIPAVQDPAAFNAGDATIGLAPATPGIAVTLSTGDSWGAGITFFGPKTSAVPKATSNATDLDGYQTLVLEAEMPKGVEFRIILDEAGVASPNEPKYDTSGGDDGESFTWPLVTSAGGLQKWSFALKDLETRHEWGAQNGKHRVDTSSLKGPAVIFSPGLKNSTVTLRSLRFEK